MYQQKYKNLGLELPSILLSEGINHNIFIEMLVKVIKPSSYLELGVYDGATFNKIVPLVERSVGVDLKDLRKSRPNNNTIFYTMSTDTFFKINQEKFDLIFIDASHNYKDVKSDFLQSFKILNEDGIILLHDTNPSCKELTQEGYCSDAYKMNSFLETLLYKINYVTLPITEAGLTIVTKKDNLRFL